MQLSGTTSTSPKISHSGWRILIVARPRKHKRPRRKPRKRGRPPLLVMKKSSLTMMMTTTTMITMGPPLRINVVVVAAVAGEVTEVLGKAQGEAGVTTVNRGLTREINGPKTVRRGTKDRNIPI
jgi:hypothetical protein